MSEEFDPYLKWLAIPPEEQPPNHYRLLGVPLFMSDTDVICNAADQRMAHVKNFQNSQHSASSQRLLNDISVARKCLLDIEKKAEYDAQLRRQTAAQTGAAVPTPKNRPARSAAAAPPTTVDESPWPIVDEGAGTREIGAAKGETGKRGSTFKPKRRQLNPAYVVVPVFVLVLGIGLVVFWSLKPETDAPVIGNRQPPPATVPVLPAPVANVPPAPAKDLTPVRPVVEKQPPTPATSTPKTDLAPKLPDPPPAAATEEITKIPPVEPVESVKKDKSAPLADDDFPTGDEPALDKDGAQASTKVPVKAAPPDEAARAKALAEVKSILADDYAKLEKGELAKKLMEYAQASPPGTARTYVLLQEGGKAAVAAGDGATILELVDALASQFDIVQAADAKAKALQNAAKAASKSNAAALATFILEFSQSLQNEEKFELASELSESALSVARKAGDNELVHQAVARRKEIMALRKDYEHAAQAIAQLKLQPSDPQANQTVGKYYALTKGNWDKGLPMLAAGGDAAWKEAATLDLAQPKEADKQVAVGDAWWTLSSKSTGTTKAQLQARAVHWYEQALPQVTDALAKVKVQKRLDEAGPQDKAASQGEAPTPAIAGTGRSGSVKTNSIGMKLVLVAAGDFVMGSPLDEGQRNADEAQHRVKISKPFYIGMYEVTQAEYQRVMGNNPSKHVTGSPQLADKDTRRFPVEQVSWQDAMAFCQRLGAKENKKYRLPTEAEWEYACRAGTKSAFNFGASASSAQGNFNGHIPYGDAPKMELLGRATVIGAYAPNRLGLCDMHGNVFEWCSDSYAPDYYARSAAVDPAGPPPAADHVVRGGCWGDPGNMCRSASRAQRNGSQNFDYIGFRVVCER